MGKVESLRPHPFFRSLIRENNEATGELRGEGGFWEVKPVSSIQITLQIPGLRIRVAIGKRFQLTG